jgi:hypothetical protein
MDLNKKLIDQLSDLSRNIKSLTSEVKENKNAVSAENANSQKEPAKEDPGKKEPVEDQNKKFLKSLEDIFKKGIGEITKSNKESNSILKDVVGSKEKGLGSPLVSSAPLKDKSIEGITSNIKTPKGVAELLGKIPKFAAGGVMDETGLALVGEKGPEVVKLDKGDEVIPNKKSSNRDDKMSQLLAFEVEDANKKKSEIKTADQNLSSPAKKSLNENSTLDEVKAKLMQEDPVRYSLDPDSLEEDAEYELSELKEKRETFTQEDIQKLSPPVKDSNPVLLEEKKVGKEKVLNEGKMF